MRRVPCVPASACVAALAQLERASSHRRYVCAFLRCRTPGALRRPNNNWFGRWWTSRCHLAIVFVDGRRSDSALLPDATVSLGFHCGCRFSDPCALVGGAGLADGARLGVVGMADAE